MAVTAAGVDRRPHSRACGITPHDHGPACSNDCPTCKGGEIPETAPHVDDSLKSHESTKRVLYHVVNTYQGWRNERLGIPNEFTDDAIRIGESHLRDVDWFPENEGWLSDQDEWPTPSRAAGDVLDLIDKALKWLVLPNEEEHSVFDSRRKKGWVEGVNTTKKASVAALQKIRDAYVTETLTRQTEADRTYGVTDG